MIFNKLYFENDLLVTFDESNLLKQVKFTSSFIF